MSSIALNYLNQKWNQDLERLKSEQLYRTLFSLAKNDERLNFSSNDYLGLRKDPRILQAGFLNAQKFGSGAGASRIVLQSDEKIEELEHFFSQKTGFLKSLFFPSGFVANINFFDALQAATTEELEQEIFCDHRCHASIYFGLQKTNLSVTNFRHHDYEHLEKKLKNSKAKAKIIVVESLYSMDGDLSHGPTLSLLCERYDALLFIDESHSIGIYGPEGMGWVQQIPNWQDVVLGASFGCGKAIGVCGGFLALNSVPFAERIKQKAKMFLFSTGVSPFLTGAVFEALKIISGPEGEERRKKLWENVRSLTDQVNKIPFEFPLIFQRKEASPIFPFVFIENDLALKVSQSLIEKNIIAKAIRPPTVPKNTSRLRVCLNSSHSKNDLNYLVQAIINILEESI